MTEPALRSWEQAGVLPRAVRRWSGRENRVYYARWEIGIVALLRDLQAGEMVLADIAPALRAAVPEAIAWVQDAEPEDAGGPHPHLARLPHAGDWRLRQHARHAAEGVLLSWLDAELARAVRRWQNLTGKRVDSVRLSLRRQREDGRPQEIGFRELRLDDRRDE